MTNVITMKHVSIRKRPTLYPPVVRTSVVRQRLVELPVVITECGASACTTLIEPESGRGELIAPQGAASGALVFGDLSGCPVDLHEHSLGRPRRYMRELPFLFHSID